MIVESLNAEVLGKEVNGLRIAPTLDSLASLPGTVTFDNVICQIDKSGSSDGHLLLLTGLMPPEQVSYCFKFGSTNRFHSLQDAFPRHTKKTMLATTGTFWNEAKVLANFGTGPVSTIKDLDGDVEEIGRDGVLIQNAIEEMRNLPRPFFLTLMTISMHIPFEEEAWPLLPQLAESDSLNRFERNYYNVTHYFDRYLKQLVDNLPPNTVLFIASDHSQDISRGTDESTRPAVFMAAGCGRSGRISRPVGQVNLYPATLELLGASFDGYGGVAMSALNPAVRGTLDTKGARRGFMTEAEIDTLKEAKRISDLIIRSNYFKDEQY
ncbi:MAG: sulfatase-like hydrolase/transferase [Muribaculaceae bacterium]|nr:sulfatase-like hydrolase/transferase [Muribaculaceae bacterium]